MDWEAAVYVVVGAAGGLGQAFPDADGTALEDELDDNLEKMGDKLVDIIRQANSAAYRAGVEAGYQRGLAE